jgi:hypothetical protein
VRVSLPLYGADGTPRWKEHPTGRSANGGAVVDVAALPFDRTPRTFYHPFPIESADSDAYVAVGDTVSVIGFPRGVGVAGNWPVWITGHIASEPDFDYDDRPVFLIDARTRSGMSGSPVVLRTQLAQSGKDVAFSMVRRDRFLGIYAGRLKADLDIGYVWRPHVLTEILTGQVIETSGHRRFNAHLAGSDSPIRDLETPVDLTNPEEW